MSRRIMLAIPSYSGKLDHTLVHALMTASSEAHQMGWTTDLMMRTTDSIITRSRNVLAMSFLRQSECSDILFIDDDVAWAPGSIKRIFSHNVDVVGGSYPARGDNVFPPFVLKPMQHHLQADPSTGLMEVEGLPAGFLRISRACLEKMAEARADRWYEDLTAPGLKVIDFFDFELNTELHQYFSEDYMFCRRWRELGGKVWVDPELTLHHTGQKTFSGCLGTWLRGQWDAKAKHDAEQAAAAAAAPKSVLDEARAYLPDAGTPRMAAE